jgi:hypothetical protein
MMPFTILKKTNRQTSVKKIQKRSDSVETIVPYKIFFAILERYHICETI